MISRHISAAAPKKSGPRAVLGSQRARLQQRRGTNLDVLSRWRPLRAEDGSRSAPNLAFPLLRHRFSAAVRSSNLLLLLLGLWTLDFGLRTSQAAPTSAPSPLDEASFNIITKNNIFNPRRSAAYIPPDSTKKPPAPQVDFFALVGIMSYEKGPFAFFEGSGSEYRKVAKPGDSIAGFKVAAIEESAVKLVGDTNTLAAGTNTIVMPVNMQMHREKGGPWTLSLRSENLFAASDRSGRSDRSRYDRNGRGRSSDPRDNIPQTQPVTEGTNQVSDVITAVQQLLLQDSPPDLPPPDAIVDEGSDTNEDPVLRALRLRRERETNP